MAQGHDPIADALTIIRNGSSSKKETVEIRNSRIMRSLIEIFKKEGFISAYKLIEDKKQGILRIYMRYAKDGVPAIMGISRISKPSLRIYRKLEDLPRVYGGLGVAVISTSSGLMTDQEARSKNVGGEVICQIW